QFETEVQFSYDDLISFGKLSRDWNPIHYYPDDGRVQHLSKMFRIRSLEEIQVSQNRVDSQTSGESDAPLQNSDLTDPETPEEPPTTPQVPIIPGALLNNIISGMIGTHLPGPGTLILSQTLDYKSRVFVDEKVRFRVRVVNVRKMLVWASYKAWVMRRPEGKEEEEKVVVLKGDAKLVYRR
ncbi:hypothetical protein WDU94_002033, partial [Cyamophila willieti]